MGQVLEDPTVMQAAYHEAGHVVAAIVIGQKFLDVSIGWNPGERSHGRLRPTRERWPPDNYEPGGLLARYADSPYEYCAVLHFAGGIAERIATGGAYHNGMYQDYWCADDSLRCLMTEPHAEEGVDYFNRTQLRTEEMVREHWGAIEAVARALQADRILDVTQARALIEPRLGGATWSDLCARAMTRELAGERAPWFDLMEVIATNENAPERTERHEDSSS